MTNGIRAILLDLGKVLVDFDLGRFGEWIIPATGVSAEELRSLINAGGLAVNYETGVVGDADFHGELCRRTSTRLAWDEFVGAWNSIFLAEPLVPDEILAQLAENAPMWIVSNTNRIHFDFIAKRYSFIRYFRGFILSHEVGAMKPDRRIFENALQRAGVGAGEALFVDDQIRNVEAARELGMDAFQFLNVDQFTHELAARDLLFRK
jgi:putative hydrolase of the HAD superfamily